MNVIGTGCCLIFDIIQSSRPLSQAIDDGVFLVVTETQNYCFFEAVRIDDPAGFA